MPALQREAAWAERLLGDLWQPVHQNGRVRLYTIEKGAQTRDT